MLKDLARSMMYFLGVNPKKIVYFFRGMPVYFINLFGYMRNDSDGRFAVRISSLYPMFMDRYLDAGSASGHYFHQDLWAARKIYERDPQDHVDIGSRVDGFIAHLLVFRSVKVVDVRPMHSDVAGLDFIQSDMTALDFAHDSIDSLSCLHAIEHVGLGRYGDSVDPQGWRKGLGELQRVLAPGGRLYLGTPIGEEKLYYDAHRVFDPKTLVEELPDLQLLSFSYVDDAGDIHENVALSDTPGMKYGCGLYEFTK